MRKLILILSFFIFFSPCVHTKNVKPYQSVVVIDAGHGGLDLGTKAKGPYCEEKRVALTTALLTKKYLDQLGYKVILTRSTDVFIPLSVRVKKASPARTSLFISLHYNSSPNKSANGIEIFYCDKKNGKNNNVTSSKKLATKVLTNVIKRTQAKSRGVKKGNFYVIRETKIPAVLLEGGFISNNQERSKLKKKQYLDKIARGIAEGVDHYFKS